MSNLNSEGTDLEQAEGAIVEPPSEQDERREPESDKAAEEFASKIIRRAAAFNGVKINRASFLRTELKKNCPDADIDLAIRTTPAEAGVPAEKIDKIAHDAIDFETKKCAALSFAAGIPGGAALAATVPADLVQYFAHVMRIEQKLAYIYGWQTFLDDNDEVDDQTVMEFVLLMGVMLGVGGAASSITRFATNVAQAGATKAIQRKALTKTVFYPIMKKVLNNIGVKLTKETFAKAVSKAVPVVGGLLSGGLTYASFKPGAEHLRQYLRALPTSGISDIPEKETKPNAVEIAASQAKEAASTAAGKLPEAGSAIANGAATAGKAAAHGAAAAGKAVAGGAKTAASAAAGAAKSVGSLISSVKKK